MRRAAFRGDRIRLLIGFAGLRSIGLHVVRVRLNNGMTSFMPEADRVGSLFWLTIRLNRRSKLTWVELKSSVINFHRTSLNNRLMKLRYDLPVQRHAA